MEIFNTEQVEHIKAALDKATDLGLDNFNNKKADDLSPLKEFDEIRELITKATPLIQWPEVTILSLSFVIMEVLPDGPKAEEISHEILGTILYPVIDKILTPEEYGNKPPQQ